MRKLQLLLQMRFTNSLKTEMPKFMIDVALDGYDTEEDMLEDCNEDAINDALRNYGFLVQYVRLIEE